MKYSNNCYVVCVLVTIAVQTSNVTIFNLIKNKAPLIRLELMAHWLTAS